MDANVIRSQTIVKEGCHGWGLDTLVRVCDVWRWRAVLFLQSPVVRWRWFARTNVEKMLGDVFYRALHLSQYRENRVAKMGPCHRAAAAMLRVPQVRVL